MHITNTLQGITGKLIQICMWNVNIQFYKGKDVTHYWCYMRAKIIIRSDAELIIIIGPINYITHIKNVMWWHGHLIEVCHNSNFCYRKHGSKWSMAKTIGFMSSQRGKVSYNNHMYDLLTNVVIICGALIFYQWAKRFWNTAAVLSYA